MYQKPSLQRFGTFREVTRGGVRRGFGDSSGGFFRFIHTRPTTS
jgi:hypothetical protein